MVTLEENYGRLPVSCGDLRDQRMGANTTEVLHLRTPLQTVVLINIILNFTRPAVVVFGTGTNLKYQNRSTEYIK